MINYQISGHLYLAEEFQLGLENPLFYQLNGLEVFIKNSPENKRLNVTVKVNSENKESAIIRAENELQRVSNLISWFHNVPIIKCRISGITFSKKKDSQNVVVMMENLSLSAKLCIMKTMGEESIKKFNEQLTKSYDRNFEEILIMWREALVEQSKGLKFFLFYRILERLCSSRREVERFIEGKIISIERRNDWRGHQVTIFTFLRDNIHSKNQKFPYKEIERHLPQMQNLVRTKIQESFPI
ncbi:MAG: hypothetical protein AMJ90_00430 [candidate division Zixibacteria bacterium SM23_73_2]|nr:MAG: hypothetical protein AMJ90_00430 [candidate division Zixibacteria bacterium SM23_73_2]